MPFAMRVTRRQLRFSSGLVLMFYMVVHMTNHALGLVSLDAAERGLAVAVALWQSAIGTVLLYGAAAVHIALAFVALNDRPSLRLPPLEIVRIAAGFSIPVLLIGHLANTRAAVEAFNAAPTYARVVGSIWASDGEARQLALLAPGWLHGCLGVFFALRHRAWFARVRAALAVLALALPLLAGLGFVALVGAVSELGVPTQQIATQAAAGAIRSTLLGVYGAGFAAVLASRLWRRRAGAAR